MRAAVAVVTVAAAVVVAIRAAAETTVAATGAPARRPVAPPRPRARQAATAKANSLPGRKARARKAREAAALLHA